MTPCGHLFIRRSGDDAIPCGTRLWWGVGTAPKTSEVFLCDSCIQKQKDEEHALEEATKP